MTERVSRWAKPDHPPCPEHGKAHFDQSGRCLPSCGFGHEVDPIQIIRAEFLAEQEQENER